MVCFVSFRGIVYCGATNLWKCIQLFCSNFSISNWICLFLRSFLPKGSWFMEFPPICVYLVLNLLFFDPNWCFFSICFFFQFGLSREIVSLWMWFWSSWQCQKRYTIFSSCFHSMCNIWHCFIIWVCKFCLAWIVWFSSCTLGFGCREYSGQVRMMLSCLRLWCAIQGLGMYGASGNDILDVNIMKCGWGSILKLAFGLNVTAAAWP